MAENHVIEDDHLRTLLEEAEAEFSEEMQGRDPQWPTVAALSYWHMAETCRRFLSLPHHP